MSQLENDIFLDDEAENWKAGSFDKILLLEKSIERGFWGVRKASFWGCLESEISDPEPSEDKLIKSVYGYKTRGLVKALDVETVTDAIKDAFGEGISAEAVDYMKSWWGNEVLINKVNHVLRERIRAKNLEKGLRLAKQERINQIPTSMIGRLLNIPRSGLTGLVMNTKKPFVSKGLKIDCVDPLQISEGSVMPNCLGGNELHKGLKIDCADPMQISDESVGSNTLGGGEMGDEEGSIDWMDIDGQQEHDMRDNEGGGGGDDDGEDSDDEFIPLYLIPIYKICPKLSLKTIVGHVRRSDGATFYTFGLSLCHAWVAHHNLNYPTLDFDLRRMWPNYTTMFYTVSDATPAILELNRVLEGDDWNTFFTALRFIEVEKSG